MPFAHMRQQMNAQQIMQRIRSEHSNLYSQLQQAGINRQIADYAFFLLLIIQLTKRSLINRQPRFTSSFKDRYRGLLYSLLNSIYQGQSWIVY